MIQMYFFRVPKDKQNEVDLINTGQFGRLIAGEEGTISKTGEITSISFSLSFFFNSVFYSQMCRLLSSFISVRLVGWKHPRHVRHRSTKPLVFKGTNVILQANFCVVFVKEETWFRQLMWLLVPLPQPTNSRQRRRSCSQQGWTHRGNMLLSNPPARLPALCDEWHCWRQRWQF